MKYVYSKKATYVLFVLGLFASVVVFVLLSQWSQQHEVLLTKFTNQTGAPGVFAYITLMALSIIVAPLGTGFLIPIAANSYGPVLAALYSIVGWTIGSLIVFFLLRQFKKKTIKHTTLIKKVTEYENTIPRSHYYFLLILLRMALPVDVLSYVLGFASSISYKGFLFTTVLGITPMTFLFTYSAVGTASSQIEVSIFATSITLVTAYLLYKKQKTTRKQP